MASSRDSSGDNGVRVRSWGTRHLSPLFGDVLGLGGSCREYSMDLISRSLPTFDDF